MKYLSLAVCALLLAACANNTNRDDAKIKESITSYLTAGVEKKDMLKIDSIGIASIDTLTEKNCLKISLDRMYNNLKELNAIYTSGTDLLRADSGLLKSLELQKALYDKHGEKYDDQSLKELVVKMAQDSGKVTESRATIQIMRNRVDSVMNLYNNADSVTFYAYYVGANIYLAGGTQEAGTYIISKDWKVSR